jgi:hypothetical protein
VASLDVRGYTRLVRRRVRKSCRCRTGVGPGALWEGVATGLPPVHQLQAVRAPVSAELRASQASAPSPAWPAVSLSEELRSARPSHPFHLALHHHGFERGASCRHALTLGCALRVFYPFSPAAPGPGPGPAPRHILFLFWTLYTTTYHNHP